MFSHIKNIEELVKLRLDAIEKAKTNEEIEIINKLFQDCKNEIKKKEIMKSLEKIKINIELGVQNDSFVGAVYNVDKLWITIPKILALDGFDKFDKKYHERNNKNFTFYLSDGLNPNYFTVK